MITRHTIKALLDGDGVSVPPQELQELARAYVLAEPIVTERLRQVDEEGFLPHLDLEKYAGGELVLAGSQYLYLGMLQLSGMNTLAYLYDREVPPMNWPWDPSWWKPSKDPVTNLAKGGALVAAEITRHRLALAATGPEEPLEAELDERLP